MAFLGLIDREKAGQQRRARALCETMTRLARQPAFFGAHGVPDSLQGRLELVMLHAALLLMRLRDDPAQAQLAQMFVDRLFKSFDEGLREAGVGDLTVPKSMRRIAGRFYDRLQAYEGPARNGQIDELAPLLQALFWADAPSVYAQSLARYAVLAFEQIRASPAEQLHELSCWPPAPLQQH